MFSRSARAGFSFSNKKVLVAGGTGLIGIPLVRMLIDEEGARVRIASLDSYIRAHPQAEFMNIDLLDPQNCIKVCKEMDYVFNLLCVKGSPERVKKEPETMFRKNLLLDVNLSSAAVECGVQGFLLASSLAVYAPAERFFEDSVRGTEPSENDWYAGWAKRMGELHLEACRRQYKMENLCIVRPTNTYGPFDDFESDFAMVVPALIRLALSGENPLVLKGDGSAIRDFLHADDVASGMLHVAKKGFPEPVNLGSGAGVTIRQLVEAILENIEPRPEVIWGKPGVTGDRIRILDTTRAKSIGFEPRISLREGIKNTVRWYKNHKDTYRNTRFNTFSPH